MGETNQDQKGVSSSDEKGTTSEKEPETLTREQANKEISDKLAAAGRDAKALDVRGKALEAQAEALKAEQAKITQWQEARDAEEIEAAQGDSEALTQIKRKKALRDREKKLNDDRAILEKDKLEHKAKIDAAEETEREIVIWEVAQKQGVDASKLKEICTELNLQTKEQIERVAKEMGAGKAPPKLPLKPDSGETRGGAKDLSGMSSRQAFRSHLDDKK